MTAEEIDQIVLVGGSTRTILLEAGLNISFTYLLAWSAGQLAKQLGQAHTEIAQSKLDIRNLQTLSENILASQVALQDYTDGPVQ